MKPKSKSAIVLLGTLVLGILLGGFGWSAIHNQRIDRMHSLRNSGTLSHVVQEVVKPVDSAQSARIDSIATAAERDLKTMYREVSTRRSARFDSMRISLEDILSPEQVERLEEWINRNRRNTRRSSRENSRQR
jgi:hypothetical protein